MQFAGFGQDGLPASATGAALTLAIPFVNDEVANASVPFSVT
jgi:hypothetical protein